MAGHEPLGASDPVRRRCHMTIDSQGAQPEPAASAGNPASFDLGTPSGAGPLAGVRVADFTWFGAGTLTGQWLGNLGAEVIHVESAGYRPDPVRQTGPYAGGIPGINRSIYYNSCNSNKLGIALNLNHPRGLEVARRLIRSSDVVVENHTPKAMRKWGLDYET